MDDTNPKVVHLVSGDNTPREHRGLSAPWEKGQPSPNPSGRPRGSKSKLSEAFLSDLNDAWEAHGKKALEKCAIQRPDKFVSVVSGLLPREVVIAALNMNANLSLAEIEDAKGFLEAYRYARDRIGAVPIEAKPIEGAVVTESWRADDDD
jgi:hypothetical protein